LVLFLLEFTGEGYYHFLAFSSHSVDGVDQVLVEIISPFDLSFFGDVEFAIWVDECPLKLSDFGSQF